MKAFIIGIVVFFILSLFGVIYLSAKIINHIDQYGLKSIIEEIWEGTK